MTAATKTNIEPDDVDLLLLLERSILFFKKYKWVFIVAALLGLTAGYLFYRSIPKTYKSRLVVHSFILTNQEQLQIVDNWNQLLKKGEYTALSSIFQCPETIFYKVKELNGKEILQVFTPQNPNGFTIDAIVTDNSVLDSLQKGIVLGFENSEYIKERLFLKRQSLQELIEKTTTEIQKLDSTKRIMERIIAGKQNTSSSLIVDGSSINRQLIEMNEKLVSFKESLRFTDAVQVFQNFSKFKLPVGPNLFVWLFLGLVFFVGLAYVFALVNSIQAKLRRRSALPS